jgi:AsmA family protein
VLKKWKLILGILCAAIVLPVVAAYIVLLTYNYNSLKPEIERVVRENTGRTLTLAGDISLKIGLTPALVVKEVSFQNASWGSQPNLAKVKRFELEVKLLPLLSHQIEVKRLVLIEPEILLETDKSGKSNLAFDTVRKEAPSKAAGGWKLPGLTFNDLHIEKGRIAYVDRELKKKYVVTVGSLKATVPDSESPIKLEMKGTYNNEPFEVNGSICPLAAFISPARDWPINFTVKAESALLTLAGTIKDPLARRGIRLNFTFKVTELANFKQLIGDSFRPRGQLDVTGRISDQAREVYSLSNLKIQQGESDLSGSVGIDMTTDRPKVAADLSARRLDLRPFVPTESVKDAGKKDKIFSDKPLGLDALRPIDAEVKLRAAQLMLPNRPFSNFEADVLLKAGDLAVKSFSAGLGQGSLKGHLFLQSQGKIASLALALKISKADISYMTKEVRAAESLKGHFDLDIDVSARGASMAGVMATLNGKSVLVIGKGRFENKYIDLLGGDLSSSVFRLLNPFQKESRYIEINCCVAGFNIKDGKATATSLVLNTDRMVVVGEGDIDLKTERLNVSLKPVPKDGIGTSTLGKLNISLSEITKPFKLGGTLARPSLALDPAQTAIVLGRTIGGVALFGPAGIAAALVGSGSADENSCSAAIDAAKKGVKLKKGVMDDVSEGAGKLFKDAGKELDKLLGR